MPNASFFITQPLPAVQHDHYEAILKGSLNIHMLGFVEYRDVFGRKHRSGYARRYVHKSANNNLVFVTKRGYNYDVDIEDQDHASQDGETE
jgi:hypothetical protein